MTSSAERRSGRLNEPSAGRGMREKFVPSSESFGLFSEATARYFGTSKFIGQMSIFIVVWLGWNILAPQGERFDPYTFTFLTLLLSLQASYAAPLILLAQGRQTDRDQVSLVEDRQRAALNTEINSFITRELAELKMRMNSIAAELGSSGYPRSSGRDAEIVQYLRRIEESLVSHTADTLR